MVKECRKCGAELNRYCVYLGLGRIRCLKCGNVFLVIDQKIEKGKAEKK